MIDFAADVQLNPKHDAMQSRLSSDVTVLCADYRREGLPTARIIIGFLTSICGITFAEECSEDALKCLIDLIFKDLKKDG